MQNKRGIDLSSAVFLGIDPGFSGALAVISYPDRKILSIIDMPLTSKASKSRKKGSISILDHAYLSEWLKTLKTQHEAILAFIEAPGAMPGQGLSSTFRFGEGVGVLYGLLAASSIPFVKLAPSVWKGGLGLSRDKALSLKKAKELFPGYEKKYFSLKKHDGRAEACLMCEYAYRFLATNPKIVIKA